MKPEQVNWQQGGYRIFHLMPLCFINSFLRLAVLFFEQVVPCLTLTDYAGASALTSVNRFSALCAWCALITPEHRIQTHLVIFHQFTQFNCVIIPENNGTQLLLIDDQRFSANVKVSESRNKFLQ